MSGFGSSFPVDIDLNWTIGDLKKAILLEIPRQPPGLVATELTIYCIAVPDGKGEDLVESLRTAPREELGVSSQELSKIFRLKGVIDVGIRSSQFSRSVPCMDSHWNTKSEMLERA